MSLTSFRAGLPFLLAGLLSFLPTAHAATYQSLYALNGGNDGSQPEGQLVMDKAGQFYGTTITGGVNGGGTVFRFNPVTNTYTVLYAFTIGGATGTTPAAGVIFDKKGMLYGTTQRGGGAGNCAYSCGTVFQLNPTTGVVNVLHAFAGPGDGSTPSGRLVFDKAGKTLFGTALYGGDTSDCANNGCGTVFKIDVATKNFVPLHTFSLAGHDGISPAAGLTFDKTGLLYGTTNGGGDAMGSGVLFAIDPSTSGFSVRHTFDHTIDGAHPRSDLTLRSGIFWGTTQSGGSGEYGTVFTYNPVSGAFANVHNQVTADGIAPYAAPVAGPKGQLYGTTTGGGRAGAGTVYAIKPNKTFAYTLAHDLVPQDGAVPIAGLVVDKKGSLYGVTSYGNGTIFKITP